MFKSALYIMNTIHHRYQPKERKFKYSFIWFGIDLKNIPKNMFFSHNKFNLFTFKESDYFYDIENNSSDGLTVRIKKYVKRLNPSLTIDNIYLVSQVRTLGYLFNPISLYFCYDEQNQSQCAIAEVENTFRERKLYYIPKSGKKFNSQMPKEFYVSPFLELNHDFRFNLTEPSEKINLIISNYKNKELIFSGIAWGKSQLINSKNLLTGFFRIPFSPLKVIFLIHFQAVLLFFSRLKYYPKHLNLDKQKNYYPSNFKLK